MRILKSVLLTIAIALPLQSAADITPLPPPAGDPVLIVTGDFPNQNSENAAIFDIEMIQALPQSSFTTSTIWTENLQAFKGVKLDTLLRGLGISEGTLTIEALNDYSVEVPVSELLNSEALLAHSRNGVEMSVRDMGPLWVVYPYDADDKLRNEVIYSRSVWQVDLLSLSK